MNKKDLPLRENYEYIDMFEPYEFTHCIVYEFARRNPNVENILNFLDDIFGIYECMIYKLLYTYNQMMKKEEKVHNKKLVEDKIKQTIISLLKTHTLDKLTLELDDLSMANIREKVSKLIILLTDELYENYYIIYQNEYESILKHCDEIYDRKKYLERDKALTEHVSELVLEQNLEEHYKISYGTNDIFTVFESIKKDEKQFTFNSIYPNYKTALRDFTDTKLYINLKLPQKELEAYLKKVKAHYNSKNSIIKTKLELLEDELELEKEELSRDKRMNWADCFFIYDYYQYSLKEEKKTKEVIKKELILLLSKYYYIEKIEETNDKGKPIKVSKITWEYFLKEYVENDEEYKDFLGEEMKIDLDGIPEVRGCFSDRTIADKFEKMDNYIKGENPKYKILIDS